MDTNQEKKVVEEEAPTSLTSQIEAIDNGEEVNKKTEKTTWTTEKIIKLLLAIFVVLFLISLYFFYFPPTPKPVDVNPEDIEEVVSTPLPSELTEVNSPTVLVNKNYPLPADYVPGFLVSPYVLSTSDVIQVNEIAAADLKEMYETAKENGVTLYLSSGYVSYETQEDLYADRVSLVGEAEASKTFPKAGCSEHQTGLAFDFTDDPANSSTSVSFEETKAGIWLKENSYKYGFILRYPKGKESITGYNYMPWHFRYVGKSVAKAMHRVADDLTMEEYFEVGQ